MLIAQMTDIHIGFDPAAGPKEGNLIRFRQAIAHLLDQPMRIDMLMLSGDLTDRGKRESFATILDVVMECPFPVYPALGNHDSRDELMRAFPLCDYEGGFAHYALDTEGLRILVLDSVEEGRHGGAFCEQRAEWLSGQLSAHPDTPTLIFVHHPPVATGIDWMDPDPDAAWIARLGDAVEGHGQIVAIQCGHLHRAVTTRFRGIPLGIVPAIAPQVALDTRPLAPDEPDGRALIVAEPPAYVLHRWDGRMLVSHNQTVGEWQVLERFGPHLREMIMAMVAERA